MKNLSLDVNEVLSDVFEGVIYHEEWKSVSMYEGLYEISTFGRLKSLPKKVKIGKNKHRTTCVRILKGHITKAGYRRYSLCKNGFKKQFFSHALGAIAFKGHSVTKSNKIVVDHKDNNPLNNNINNLQVVTQRHNSSKDRKGYSSKYTGVSWEKSRCKWVSAIQVSGKSIQLGRFTDEYQAHLAYQNKLKQING